MFLVKKVRTKHMFFRVSLGDTGVRSETHPHKDYPRKMVYQRHLYTELFHLKPYKFAVVQKLQKENCVAKVRFCNRLCEAVCTGEGNVLLTSF